MERYQETALYILEHVGGLDNLIHAGCCATRLRLQLMDNSKINEEQLKKNNTVRAVRFSGDELQLIIGLEAFELSDILEKLRKQ